VHFAVISLIFSLRRKKKRENKPNTVAFVVVRSIAGMGFLYVACISSEKLLSLAFGKEIKR
jgi:hypothetical protein